MTTAHGKTISYTYDALKRLTNKDVKNGATAVVAYAYAYKNGTTSGTTTPLVEYHNVRTKDGSILTGAKYSYDAVGNITGIYESQLVGTNTTRRPLALYVYDNQNQLTRETIYTYEASNLTTTPTTTTVYEYSYDTAGNILSEKVNGTTTKTYTYGNAQWADLLTKFNGSTNYYDTVGNPLIYNNGNYRFTMEWERGRQLSKATYSDSTATFAYDIDGIRMAKIVDGTPHRYLTQNGKVVRETIGTGSTAKVLDFIYDESGNPCALIYTNGTATPLTYYYVLNLQGDVVKLVNANGESRAEYTYNAWGEILTSSGTMADINPLRYRGYYYDTETGFYYLQSRYYDPITHRFLNADSFASTGTGILGYNMFAYCNNNPVIYSDHCGNSIMGALLERIKEVAANIMASIEKYISKKPEYITDQNAPGVGDIDLGWSSVGHGGCGVIATYNALLMLGKEPSLKQIACSYEERDYLIMNGSLGIGPWSVADWFVEEGYDVYVASYTMENYDNIMAYSLSADASILFYAFTSDSFPYIYAHFAAYERCSKGFQYYNVPDGTTIERDPMIYAASGSRFAAYGIFIFKKG